MESLVENNKKYRDVFDLDGYQIEVSNSTTYETIKKDWKYLERNSTPPFFLSWHWISTWIQTYSPDLITVSARQNGHIVALGLFTESVEIRHKIIRSRQLRLHQLGGKTKDQIWIEYNDFICLEQHRHKAVNCCLAILQLRLFPWDEIVISTMRQSRAKQILSFFPETICEMPIYNYATNLKKIRLESKSYLQTLSPNTRHQIRRSIRLYEKLFGSVTIEFANNPSHAESLFGEAGQFHITRWKDSGFNNPDFTRFHINLIQGAFESGHVQLCRLKAGDKTIAILYHHILNKTVYFYLQGIYYHENQKLKPGLVAHTLATEHYLASGMDSYDYMGGYSQYKCQLAERSEDFYRIVIQRPRSRFRVETIARAIKKSIMSAIKI